MATKDIGTLRTRLSWEDDGNKAGMEGLKRDLKGLRSEMNLARSGGKDYTNSLKGMREQSNILTRQFKTQETQVKELRKRHKELTDAGKEDTVAAKNLESQINNTTAQMNRTEGQLKSLNDEIRRMESPWTKIGETMTKTGDTMQKVGRGMTSFGKEYSMKVTAPIVAGGVAAFKASMDFESAFAGVEKTFSGTTDQLADLRVGIREMAKEIPASTTEISAVAEAAGQLGVEAENVEEFTRTMIDLGEATNMTAEVAATEFARFANIVGMSQDDFDRLGSSTVALGNTMATTESEISSLSLRLAAQGSQVGMSESQILALAASMSSLGIEAESGGTSMTAVLKKIDSAVGESGKELEGFAKAAGVSSKEFAKQWESDPIKALDTFIKGLAESGEEGENLSAILADLGIKGIRESDTMLRLAGASDILAGAVNTSSKAWEENTALTEEAETRYATTESQLKIMWNRIKDVAITLGDALVPAVMEALDAAGPFIEKIEEGAQAFADMDEEQQQSILKMIALVAAIGPASVALGGMTTAIGGVLKVGGGLSTMLGKAGGAGLLGKVGGLGMAGPVGLAVGGVAALSVVMYNAMKDGEKLHDVNYELINSVNDEITAIDELTQRFESLHDKNSLTSDEMLRYMDIISELADAEGEKAIKKLSDEQQKLLEKSGLTNEEMAEFLELNNKIVEESPNATSAISDQGNAFVDNLDVLKELNAEKIESLLIDAQRELEKALENENQLFQDQIDLENEIKEIQADINKAQAERLELAEKLNEEEIKQEEINNKLRDLKEEAKTLEGEELALAQEKYLELEDQKLKQDEIVNALKQEKGWLDESYDQLNKNYDAKNDNLATTRDELAEVNKMIDDYEVLILKQAGLNTEKGRGLDVIDEELSKLDTQKKDLDELHKKGLIVTGDYEEQNQKLSTQRQRLLDAQEELEEVNRLAGETVYDKEVKLKTSPSMDAFNRDLSSPLTRFINLRTRGAMPIAANADGTDFHPGGLSWLGEEGPELIRKGSNWAMADFGLYDLPRGYQVFTNDESKRIMGAMNRLPAYASGISPSGEANRVVNQLNNQSMESSQPVVIEVHVTSEMDSKAVGKGVATVVTDIQNRNDFRRRRKPHA